MLTPAGRALARLVPLFLSGLGGRAGTGRQFLSWVGLDDAVGAVVHTLCSPEIEGPVNVTAPEPVPNADFAKTLARVLRRLAVVPAASSLLRIAVGELAETVTSGARALPAVLTRTGYRVRHASQDSALRHALGR